MGNLAFMIIISMAFFSIGHSIGENSAKKAPESKDMLEPEEYIEFRSTRFAILATVVVCLIWFFSPYVTEYFLSGRNDLKGREGQTLLDRLGLIGDSFGAVNSLFSALALGGAIYAVILQQMELKATRAELAGQKLAQEKQAEIQNVRNKLSAIQARMELTRLFRAQITLATDVLIGTKVLGQNHKALISNYAQQLQEGFDKSLAIYNDLAPELVKLERALFNLQPAATTDASTGGTASTPTQPPPAV